MAGGGTGPPISPSPGYSRARTEPRVRVSWGGPSHSPSAAEAGGRRRVLAAGLLLLGGPQPTPPTPPHSIPRPGRGRRASPMVGVPTRAHPKCPWGPGPVPVELADPRAGWECGSHWHWPPHPGCCPHPHPGARPPHTVGRADVGAPAAMGTPVIRGGHRLFPACCPPGLCAHGCWWRWVPQGGQDRVPPRGQRRGGSASATSAREGEGLRLGGWLFVLLLLVTHTWGWGDPRDWLPVCVGHAGGPRGGAAGS